ncbi:MAG: hypothetical protein MUE30_10420 [Spirosomaceae bacterium]|jgi:hypothetical protein|nr:hypothetical protein [Spirosomataceae bacterium]
MLILEINDTRLEQKIVEKARKIGKSVQELLKDMVAEKVQEEETEKLPFDVPRLDIRMHGKVIDTPLTKEEEKILVENPDIKPFAHIDDAAQYVHQLRRKPRH